MFADRVDPRRRGGDHLGTGRGGDIDRAMKASFAGERVGTPAIFRSDAAFGVLVDRPDVIQRPEIARHGREGGVDDRRRWCRQTRIATLVNVRAVRC